MAQDGSISTALVLYDQMTKPIETITQSANALNQSLAETNQITERMIEAPYKPIEDSTDRANEKIKQFHENEDIAAKKANDIGNQWNRIQSLIRGTVGIFSIKKVFDLSDQLTSVEARMNLVTGSAEKTAVAMEKIRKSAARTRTSSLETANAVATLELRAGSAFKNIDQATLFLETMNKQLIIAGANTQEQQSAITQMTQALGSGILRGQDFNAVLQASPLTIQSIARYIAKMTNQTYEEVYPKMREYAEKGQLTADIVRDAILNDAAEMDKKIKTMPMTWSQTFTSLKDSVLTTLEPALRVVGQGAQFIADHGPEVQAVLWGMAAAVTAYAAATWGAKLAQEGLNLAFLTNPIFWVAAGIGLLIAYLIRASQAVGGFANIWELAQIKGKIALLQLQYMASMSLTSVVGFFKWAGASILQIIDRVVNEALDKLNVVIGALNTLPGVHIGKLNHVNGGDKAMKNFNSYMAGKQKDWDSIQNSVKALEATYATKEASFKASASAGKMGGQMAEFAIPDGAGLGESIGPGKNIGNIGKVGKIENDVNIADEDLKMMKDVAEMRYVQNFVTLTPSVSMNGTIINNGPDAESMMDMMATKLEEEFIASAEGVYGV